MVHVEKCADRNCGLAENEVSRLKQVSTPCMDNHHMVSADLGTKGELSPVCGQTFIPCLYLARIGRSEISQRMCQKNWRD